MSVRSRVDVELECEYIAIVLGRQGCQTNSTAVLLLRLFVISCIIRSSVCFQLCFIFPTEVQVCRCGGFIWEHKLRNIHVSQCDKA
jgi:hypothetical protein